MRRLKSINIINKTLGIIAIVLMVFSAMCMLVMNNAKASANADYVKPQEEIEESCNEQHDHNLHLKSYGLISLGNYENMLGAKGTAPKDLTDASYTLSVDDVTFKSPCANCGCKINYCSQCYASKRIKTSADTVKPETYATKYAFICQVDEGNYCALDITKQGWYLSMMQITGIVDQTLLPIILVLGTAGTIYVIILGVKFSKAESADKREEAKKHMINAIIGVVVTLLILILVKVFTANAEAIVGWVNGV